MKKKVCGIVLSLVFLAHALDPIKSGDSLLDSANLANRRTALRCLSNATNYASEKKYGEALVQSDLGIAYDDSISDLWYLKAACSLSTGKIRAEILPLLDRSLKNDNWVNYNKDNARLMAADILSETNRLQQAMEILDANPMLYSSDAEFVRVKILYRMGDSSSLSKARNKIDGARRIYPSDTRFPLVFFKNEKPENLDPTSRRIAEYFISQVAQYQEASPDRNAELEIHAASFATGDAKRRLLRSFNARGLKHPLYALEALKEGILTQKTAFDYVAAFADVEIDYDFLKKFMAMVDDASVLEYAAKYFEAFEGSISQDTDGDGNANLLARYRRGRPQEIFYDFEQDGSVEWSIKCDFGVPLTGNLEHRNMTFNWSQFPYLNSIEFSAGALRTLSREKFVFAGESLAWTPVFMEPEAVLSQKCNVEFFYPVLNSHVEEVSNGDLLDAASSFEIDSSVSTGEKISFVLSGGNIQQAIYYKNGKMYGHAQFEDNIPKFRIVDSDEDGIFETTEFYDIDMDGTMEVHSLEDERTVMQNLYGIPSSGSEFYLRMVQVDTNMDTVPDFTEEYLEHGGKITSWDTDSSGNWNIRHVVYPFRKMEGETLAPKIEDTLFYTSPKNTLVKITTIDGRPVKVFNGNEKLSVVPGNTSDFYWLCKNEDSFNLEDYRILEDKCLELLASNGSQGISAVAEDSQGNAMCVKIGKNSFAVLVEFELPESLESNDGKADDAETK